MGAGVGAGFLPAARRLEPYRKLPERERRAVCNAIVTGVLKDFWTMRATLSPTRVLRKHFRRVTSHDAQRFADDVKEIALFTVNGVKWAYKGKLKKRTSVKLVFERIDARAPASPRELALKVLSEYEERLGIAGVKLVIRRYKTRAAFCELRSERVYLNENLLGLGEGVIRYLIAHELVHLKLRSRYHGDEFYRLFHTLVPPDAASEAEGRIVKKLFQLAEGDGAHG
jgi:predicted metal-dependent hydrolase